MFELLTSEPLLFLSRRMVAFFNHPALYSWEDVLFVCKLISVLTAVVCAVMSVKYISQLGNVEKLTPVQCLTNHIIKTSLHIH